MPFNLLLVVLKKMAVFQLPADDDIGNDCKEEKANSEEHSLELEKKLIGNSATYAQVFQRIFEKYDREFDEEEVGGEVIDLTNEAQLQRVFRTPRCKTPRFESNSPEETLDYQLNESPLHYADSTHHYPSSEEDDRGCVWDDCHAASEDKDRGCVVEDASSQDKDTQDDNKGCVWEDVHVKEEFSPHNASHYDEAGVCVEQGRRCGWDDPHNNARSSDENESVQEDRVQVCKDVNSMANPLLASSLSLIQPACPLLSRLHKKVVEIKKEMNWDEEERLHWSHVERKRQEQADYSSEEECGSTPRVVRSRVPLPGPREEEEDLMSGFIISTGEESGYEEREVRGQGFHLHSHPNHKKRKHEEYRKPAKRRKLVAPVRNLLGHVPMFCTPPRLHSPAAPPLPWTVPSPYLYPAQLTTTPSPHQSYSASPHAVLFSHSEPSPSVDSSRH